MITASNLPVLGHCIADADHRIQWCDDAYLDLLRRERAEIIGRHPLELTHELDRMSNGALLARLEQSGTAFTITKRYICGDGQLVWVTNHVSSVRDGVGPARACATSMPASSPADLSALERNATAARRLCAGFVRGKRLLGADLISAPPVEMMLALYAAEMEGRVLLGEDLARTLQLDTGTVVRWLRVLHERGLVEVEGGEAPAARASFRIARLCELALDALLASYA